MDDNVACKRVLNTKGVVKVEDTGKQLHVNKIRKARSLLEAMGQYIEKLEKL
jgi:CRISPR/Cas system CMR-associated protein Cmr3 (group 5 of RAMP superfamily)